jgi:hypothetical protein
VEDPTLTGTGMTLLAEMATMWWLQNTLVEGVTTLGFLDCHDLVVYRVKSHVKNLCGK